MQRIECEYVTSLASQQSECDWVTSLACSAICAWFTLPSICTMPAGVSSLAGQGERPFGAEALRHASSSVDGVTRSDIAYWPFGAGASANRIGVSRPSAVR